MKKISIFFFALVWAIAVSAQAPTTKQLQENAKTLLQQGDFDNAVKALEKARQQDPASLEVLRDLAYANFLKRDFARTVELGKVMIDRPDADEQSYQVLGMAYKAIASYKEAGKLYRTALRKFPNSGVIYNEFGEMSAMDKEMEEAIVQWEKGIEMAPAYSGNYYNATMYYARNQNWVRAILYGETFLNLESFSTRSTEIKQELFNAYKNLLAPGTLAAIQGSKGTSVFEKAVIGSMANAATQTKEITGIESLNTLRTHFLTDWAKEKQAKYPYRLFEHQQSMIKDGLFEAYNRWLFSSAISDDNQKTWESAHPKESAAFKKFQDSHLFRIPQGQYYFNS